MIHQETCLCNAKTIRFQSGFGVDVVSQLYCPRCVDRASSDVIVFEMCEPSLYRGHWGVRYNTGELKRLDTAFRDSEAYYLSLLISGKVSPEMAVRYGEGGLCRILGFKYGPEEERHASELTGAQASIHEDAVS
jgi:hypothetical protein